jgi:N-acyl-D-aspartate/D-glutamate deacylase
MSLDVKIVNGEVIDGSGAPARRADIGIKDGKIVAVGVVEEEAAEVIEATGLLVTPGFVDIHCHYDGQVSWDEELAPSSWHGVTTCVSGNCGVGFAPVRPTDHDRLVALMEGVEDIPGAALAEGIPWTWETFPEYMDALDAMPHAIDFAVQVPHDALRMYVMGDRAVWNSAATDEEIEQMRRLVREAMEAGAAGFSTGRTDNHRVNDGSPTPASEASARELEGIARAFEGLDYGVVQAVSDFDMAQGDERFEQEFDVVERMARASGRPLSVSLLQRDQSAEQWRWILRRVEQGNASGHPMRAQVAARGIGVLLGLEATFHPFIGFPSYKKIAHLSLAERVAAMRDPEFKAQLLTEQSEPVAGDGSAIPPLVDILLGMIEWISARIFRIAQVPNYEPHPDSSLYMEAREKGLPALEVLYDAMLEDEGHALLYFPIYNYGEGNLDIVGQMLNHPLALAGLSDGGAHVGTVCDASFPTFMLSYWARDRERGKMPVERVVKMLTSANAEFMGFHDRGVIAPGKRADLNVIDFANLGMLRPKLVQDLPAGGKRLMQPSVGYRYTLVAGEVIARDGALTGARPGRLVRACQIAKS